MKKPSLQETKQIEQVQMDLKQALELHQQGKLDAAIIKYKKILEENPDHADCNHLVGLAMLTRKKSDDLILSLKYLSKAAVIDTGQSTYENDLGNAYWNLGQIAEAAKAFSRAIRLNPDFVQPRFNLGNCYWFQGRFLQARDAYTDTLTANEDWAQARYMLANCEYTLGHTKIAIEIYRDVLFRRPELVDARLGLAYALLRYGLWSEGWALFESRLLFAEFSDYQDSAIPQWDGLDIPEKSLVVFAEQGIGDTLQFVRYLRIVKEKVGRLALVCDKSLHALLSRNAEIDDLLDRESLVVKVMEANFDYRVSLMSLPGLMKTTVNTLWDVPYYQIDKTKARKWRKYFTSGKLNIGLVWAGNPLQKDDKHRSCQLKDLLPLIKLPHVNFYSLQLGDAREQIQQLDCTSLVDLADELQDFSDTAAVISNLDLVISVDTAVAHLAGALGKPTYTMLWASHCWRYLEDRTDTHWYPTMHLFRQDKFGDWVSVVKLILTAVIAFEKKQTTKLVSEDTQVGDGYG